MSRKGVAATADGLSELDVGEATKGALSKAFARGPHEKLGKMLAGTGGAVGAPCVTDEISLLLEPGVDLNR